MVFVSEGMDKGCDGMLDGCGKSEQETLVRSLDGLKKLIKGCGLQECG